MGGNSVFAHGSPTMHQCKHTTAARVGMAEFATLSTENNAPYQHGFERAQGISVAFERCPLCSSRNVPFFCHLCINRGVFTHSKAKPSLGDKERFVDLKNKFAKERTKNWELRQREIHDEHLKAALRHLEKKVLIEEWREKIARIRAAIREAHAKCNKEKIDLLNAEKKKKRKIARRFQNTQNQSRRVETLQKNNARRGEVLKETEVRLAEVQKMRQQMAGLIMGFFSIGKTNALGESSSSLMTRTSAMMQDACQTAYHRGHWIFNDSNEDLRYSIVDVAMPANGNFTECYFTMAHRRENPGIITRRNHYQEAVNALGYTAVAVNALSWVLDVPLPRKQSHSEFWLEALNEKQLENAIARLNHNVLYLCFSQGVLHERLSPKLTLHNLVMLMDSPSFGRAGEFEVVDDMLLSLGESVSGDDSEAEMEEERGSDMLDTEEDWAMVPSDASMPAELMQLAIAPSGGIVGTMAQSAHAAQAALMSSVSGVFRWFDSRGRTDSS